MLYCMLVSGVLCYMATCTVSTTVTSTEALPHKVRLLEHSHTKYGHWHSRPKYGHWHSRPKYGYWSTPTLSAVYWSTPAPPPLPGGAHTKYGYWEHSHTRYGTLHSHTPTTARWSPLAPSPSPTPTSCCYKAAVGPARRAEGCWRWLRFKPPCSRAQIAVG